MILKLQGDYEGFNTGNGEKLSYSQAEPAQLRRIVLLGSPL